MSEREEEGKSIKFCTQIISLSNVLPRVQLARVDHVSSQIKSEALGVEPGNEMKISANDFRAMTTGHRISEHMLYWSPELRRLRGLNIKSFIVWLTAVQ
ncbi:hypothetical protein SLA2020_431490 [Shorea laevis]